MSAVSGRWRRHLADPLARSGYALILNTALTALLGFVYWVLAARLFAAHTVGAAAAVIAAMMLLSAMAQLNLSGTLMRFLPEVSHRAPSIISWSYAVSATLAATLGAAFVLLSSHFAGPHSPLRLSGWLALWFVVSVVGWCVFTLQDNALTGLRRTLWVPIENASFGVVKIGLLVVAATAAPIGAVAGIFTSWTLPVLLFLVPVNALIFLHFLPQHRVLHSRGESEHPRLRELARYASADAGAGLLQQGYVALLPIIVAARLGASANAHFFAGFQIAIGLDLLSTNLAAALLVEGAYNRQEVPALLRRTLRRAAFVVVPLAALVGVGGPLILSIYGAAYARTGTTSLRLLALAIVAKGVTTVFIALMRIEKRTQAALALEALVFGVVVTLAVVLGDTFGIAGVAGAVLAANLVAAAIAAPTVISRLGTTIVKTDPSPRSSTVG